MAFLRVVRTPLA